MKTLFTPQKIVFAIGLAHVLAAIVLVIVQFTTSYKFPYVATMGTMEIDLGIAALTFTGLSLAGAGAGVMYYALKKMKK